MLALIGGSAAAVEQPAPPAAETAPVESPAQSNPRLAAALELMDATNGQQMAAYQMEFLTNAYTAEYRQTHPHASPEDLTLFAATLDDEASKSLDEVETRFAQSFADHFSEDDLHALTAFARGDLYQHFIAALPQPLSGVGLFNLEAIAHGTKDPKARKTYELYVKFESADDLQGMTEFVNSELGKRCITELDKIFGEMSYTPGWLTKTVDRAKERTIARLRLKGVHL